MFISDKLKPVFAAALVLALAISGCVQAGTSGEAMAEKEVGATAAASPGLKLYVFDCGYITANNLAMFSSKGLYQGESKELVDTCYLVQHANGMLLWDAGLSDSLVDTPEGVVVGDGAFTLKVKKTLASQLQEIGVKPEDVTHIAFSHLHFDHTGNANNFASATWLVQGIEHEVGFGPDAAKFFFDPSSYKSLQNVQKLDGDHDVFGDGSVIIYAAPGHTHGHQVLLVRLPQTGPVVLSGDLYHFTKNRTFRRVPAFNYDLELSQTSIERVEDIVAKENAQFWIQHDPEQMSGIKHAPAFYE